MKKTFVIFSFFAFFETSSVFATQTVTSYEALLEALQEPDADVELDMQGNGINLNGGQGLSVQNTQSVVFSDIGTSGVSSWTNSSYNIENFGLTSIINSLFEENNTEITGKQGGIIRNVGGTITTISNSSFSNNCRESSGSVWGGVAANIEGGYIDTIENVSFENNFAYSQVGAPHGGIILNEGGTIDVIQNVVFKDNTMTSAPDNNGGAHGVAIDNNVNGIINKITNVQFINNKAYRSGYAEKSGNYHASAGALDNYYYISEISNVLFYQNSVETESKSAHANAGALMNLGMEDQLSGTIDKIENVQFIENYAFAKRSNASGGALVTGLYEGVGSSLISEMKNVIFKGNYVKSGDDENVGLTVYAGAIKNSGEIKSLTGYFEKNYAKSNMDEANKYGSRGGAIYNEGTIENLTADFSENYTKLWSGGSAADGGAILNSGLINNIEGSFLNNYADADKGGADGGAIKNSGEIKNITGYFEGNFTRSGRNVSGSYGSMGGAIRNTGTIENITADFNGNHVDSLGGESSAGGGVLYHKGSIDTITGNFTNNYAFSDKGKANGGAIINYSNSSIEKILGNFTENKVSSEEKTADGGAIYNIGQIDYIEGDFVKNEAVSGVLSSGGGIYNRGTVNLVDSSFVSNIADQGAAIYNRGTLSLTAQNKNINLTNNNQTGEAGGEGTGVYVESGTVLLNAATNKTITIDDLIYSDGIIKINSDETYNGGTIALNNKLEGNGEFHIQNGQVILGDDSGFSVKSSTVSQEAVLDIASNTVSTENAEISGTIKMDITNITKDSEEYSGGKINTNNLVINDTAVLSLSITNKLMGEKGAKTGDLELISQTNDTPNIFKNISSNNRYNVVAAKNDTGQYNGKYRIEYIATASDVVEEAGGTQNNINTGEAWDQADLSNPQAQEVQDLLYELSQHDAGKYVDALTNLSPTDTMLHVNMTQDFNNLITDKIETRFNEQGMNSEGFFEKGSAWIQTLYNQTKQQKTHKNTGFKGKMTMIAFGADGELKENTTLGIGYAYAQADVDSDKRNTDIFSHTIYAYGKYQPSQWYITGLVNYGFAKYKEKANVAGFVNKAHYDVQNYGIRTSVGYNFENGITPQTGLRYTHITREKYTDSFGQHVKTDDADVLTAKIGIQYQTKLETKNILWIPKIHFGVVYDLLSANSTATVRIGDSVYTIEGQKINRYGIETGFGTEMSIDRWDIAVEYNLASRKKYQSHTGLIKAKYNF